MSASPRLPQDPNLPQMPKALDPEHMARVFERELAAVAGAVRVDGCDIQRVKHKPGKACRVLYNLRLRHGADGERREHVYSARVFHPGQSEDQFLKASRRPLVAPAFGPPLLHVAALSMVAWAAPNDRKLHGMPALLDPERLARGGLVGIVAERWGRDWRIDAAAPSIAHLAPEFTCCARVDLRLVHGSSGAVRSWTVFGKTYSDDAGARVHDLMRALWASDSRRRGDLRIPPPLGFEAEHRLSWQEGLAGRTLLEADRGALLAPSRIEPTARAIAALHGAEVEGALGSGPEKLLERLGKLSLLVAETRPALGPRVAALVAFLRAGAAQIDHSPIAMLHGDLHPKNLFVDADGRGISIIDFDRAARGAPIRDVGSFVAALLHRALSAGAPPSRIRQTIGDFLRAYRARATWPTPAEAIVWHVAAALLVERAYSCMTRMKPGQLQLLERLIAMADEIGRGAGEHLGLS